MLPIRHLAQLRCTESGSARFRGVKNSWPGRSPLLPLKGADGCSDMAVGGQVKDLSRLAAHATDLAGSREGSRHGGGEARHPPPGALFVMHITDGSRGFEPALP